MAKAHVLSTSAGRATVAWHIAVPTGNNSAGIAWSAAVKNSGVGAPSRLPAGTGTDGTISTTETTAITDGTTYEIVDEIDIPAGLNAAQANTLLDAYHAARTAEVQALLQERLAYFGYTRT